MTIWIDDRRLVESHHSGDEAAFAEIVRVHQSSLMAHALRRLYDRAAAEDAVQETFVRAFRAMPRFEGEYRLGPWLHRILSNVCVDEGNRRRREAEKFDRVMAEPTARAEELDVERLLGLDVGGDLDDALATLPPSYREALELRFVDDLPYDELARTAGVSEQNARARVSRARNAARVALRGVAAIPVFALGLIRRGERTAAAVIARPASSEVGASTVRTAVGPAAELVASAGPAASLATKAVIGISLAVAATVPNSAPTDRPAAASAPTEVAASLESTAASPSKLNGGPVSTDSANQVPASAEVAQTATDAPAPTDPPPAKPAATTTSPPPTTAAVAGDQPAPTEPDPPPAPVERRSGAMSATGLAVSPAGPRVDLSGPVSLTVGEVAYSGTLSGRFEIPEGDNTAARRISATITLTLAEGEVVTLRLAGHATPVPGPAASGDDAEAEAGAEVETPPVTAFTLSGLVSATSSDQVALVDSGNFSGSLDVGAGSLNLSLG